MQGRRRLPRTITNAADELAVAAGRAVRARPAVTGEDVTVGRQAGHVELQPFDRRIDVAQPFRQRAPSSPSTCHGSSAWRSVDVGCARADSSPATRKRNSKCGSNHSDVKRVSGRRQLRDDIVEIQLHEVRQQKAIVQLSAPAREGDVAYGSCQKRATSARSSNCCARLIRACGGISNARSSMSPQPPRRASGEYSLSMQNSARCVLPVTSTSRLREHPIDEPRRTGALPGGKLLRKRSRARARVVPSLVDTRRLAVGSDETGPRTDTTATGWLCQ